MNKSFIFDRREGYFQSQDIAPDHRFALMRYAGTPTLADDIHEMLTRAKIKFKTRKWGGWRSWSKPDNSKPRRKDHRVNVLSLPTL